MQNCDTKSKDFNMSDAGKVATRAFYNLKKEV